MNKNTKTLQIMFPGAPHLTHHEYMINDECQLMVTDNFD